MTGPDASPRTDAEPMAFPSWEFFCGAVTAWWLFLPILAVLHLWVGVWALIIVLNALPWSIGALIAGAPAAWLLGRMLRRVPRIGIHLLAFAALGAIVGVATTWVAVAGGGYRGADAPLLIVLHVVAAAAAVALGWGSTARRALRKDAAGVQPAAVHRDETTARAADGAR